MLIYHYENRSGSLIMYKLATNNARSLISTKGESDFNYDPDKKVEISFDVVDIGSQQQHSLVHTGAPYMMYYYTTSWTVYVLKDYKNEQTVSWRSLTMSLVPHWHLNMLANDEIAASQLSISLNIFASRNWLKPFGHFRSQCVNQNCYAIGIQTCFGY